MFRILCILCILSLFACKDSTNNTQKEEEQKREKEDRPQAELRRQVQELETKEQTTVAELSVCDRTEAVKQAILAEVNKENCYEVKAEHLKTIIALYLDYKGLTTLKQRDFSGLTALKELWLSNNELKTLPPGIFDDLTVLKWLGLDSNKLKTLPPGIFDNLTALEGLFLRGNLFPDEEKTRIKNELQEQIETSLGLGFEI